MSTKSKEKIPASERFKLRAEGFSFQGRGSVSKSLTAFFLHADFSGSDLQLGVDSIR